MNIKQLPSLPIFPQIPLWLVEWHQTRALIEIVHVHMNIQRIAADRLMTAERARRGWNQGWSSNAIAMCLLAKPHFQFEMQEKRKKEKWNVNSKHYFHWKPMVQGAQAPLIAKRFSLGWSLIENFLDQKSKESWYWFWWKSFITLFS